MVRDREAKEADGAQKLYFEQAAATAKAQSVKEMALAVQAAGAAYRDETDPELKEMAKEYYKDLLVQSKSNAQ